MAGTATSYGPSAQRELCHFVGGGEALHDLWSPRQSACGANSAVLALGETGTGAEVVAEGNHTRSVRHRGPHVKWNCAGRLLEILFVSFEHAAFPGAVSHFARCFRNADTGMRVSNDIGDLALELQLKLLCVQQNQKLEQPGVTGITRVHVRAIAATPPPFAPDGSWAVPLRGPVLSAASHSDCASTLALARTTAVRPEFE